MKYIITESQYNRLSEQSNMEDAVLKLVKRLYIDKIEDVRENHGIYHFFHTNSRGVDVAFIRLSNGTLDTYTHGIKYDVEKFIPKVNDNDVNHAVLELMKETYPELDIKRINESPYFWYEDFETNYS